MKDIKINVVASGYKTEFVEEQKEEKEEKQEEKK
jgi:hypothetical protein